MWRVSKSNCHYTSLQNMHKLFPKINDNYYQLLIEIIAKYISEIVVKMAK